MSAEYTEVEVVNLPARIERSSVLLVPVMDVSTAIVRMKEFQSFIASYLVESDPERGIDGDYGVIPGTKKSTLLKPGADKLCEVYGLYDEYSLISTVEDWDKGLFDYTFRCVLKSRRDDSTVGTGVGSCSSFESKYRWRDSQRKCPKCQKENIRKSKERQDGTGGGWYCWVKTGGCGATFKDGDASIEAQIIGRVENPDIIDAKNTVLKMAKKRAKIDAVIGVTRSSGIFTQDMDDAVVVTASNAPPAPVTTEPIPVSGPVKRTAAVETITPLIKGTPSQPQKAADRDGGQIAEREAHVASREAEGSVGASPASSAPTDALADALMRKLADKTPPEAGSFDPEACIDLPEQRAIHRQAREATTLSSKDADVFFREWLAKRGYKDEEGRGSTKRIPRALFAEVKKECVEFMSGLK